MFANNRLSVRRARADHYAERLTTRAWNRPSLVLGTTFVALERLKTNLGQD